MLRPDVVVTQLPRLFNGELQDPLRLGSERNLAERQRFREAGERTLNLRLHRFQTQPEPLQDRRGDTFPVADETEKHVLGADEIMPEPSRLFPSEDNDPSRPFGEPFKHWSTPPLSCVPGEPFSLNRRLVNPNSHSV